MTQTLQEPRCGLSPMHPGEWLREVVLPALKDERKIGSGKVAEMLGVSRPTLNDLTAERQSVTPQMALRLARLLGTSAEFWMNLQGAYDIARVRAEMADQLAAIPPLAEAEAA